MDEIRIGFIGAGYVNFGGGEGPWDHASRLERLEGVRIVGVSDPCRERAQAVLAGRTSPAFEGAQAYATPRELLEQGRPDVVWIGVPPNAHGTLETSRDLELACAKAGVHLFIEKPLSNAEPEAVRPLCNALQQSNVLVSVGYMFRYSRAIDKMKELLAECGEFARVFVGRYNCAYSEIRKTEWWDVRQSGGPIVEQATHFVDLARYLVGEAVLSTVHAQRIMAGDLGGDLSDVPADADGNPYDAQVPDRFKAPRATAATWTFENGAIASLTHGTWLHRKKYESSIEVWADGLMMVLEDPYGDCRLIVRRPHSEESETFAFSNDDPYLSEDRAFIEAIRRNTPSLIRSPYDDAFKTFELTWAIRRAK